MADLEITGEEREQITANLAALATKLSRYPMNAEGLSDDLSTWLALKNVPVETGYFFRETCERLSVFEVNKKKLLRTTAVRKKALKALAEHAGKMASILELMPEGNERYHLECALERVGMPVQEDGAGVGELQRVEAIRAMLATLALGVKSAMDAVASDGSGGGRVEVVPDYANFIYTIATQCKPLDITPGRGGDFERLCEAIFSAAKVHAKPEQAIRYCVDNYK